MLPSGEACLRVNIDATSRGNWGRFFNHRCAGRAAGQCQCAALLAAGPRSMMLPAVVVRTSGWLLGACVRARRRSARTCTCLEHVSALEGWLRGVRLNALTLPVLGRCMPGMDPTMGIACQRSAGGQRGNQHKRAACPWAGNRSSACCRNVKEPPRPTPPRPAQVLPERQRRLPAQAVAPAAPEPGAAPPGAGGGRRGMGGTGNPAAGGGAGRGRGRQRWRRGSAAGGATAGSERAIAMRQGVGSEDIFGFTLHIPPPMCDRCAACPSKMLNSRRQSVQLHPLCAVSL